MSHPLTTKTTKTTTHIKQNERTSQNNTFYYLYNIPGFQQQQKMTEHIKVKNNTVWKGKASIRANSEMTQMRELSDREIEIIMIHKLRTLINKEDNVHEQVT